MAYFRCGSGENSTKIEPIFYDGRLFSGFNIEENEHFYIDSETGLLIKSSGSSYKGIINGNINKYKKFFIKNHQTGDSAYWTRIGITIDNTTFKDNIYTQWQAQTGAPIKVLNNNNNIMSNAALLVTTNVGNAQIYSIFGELR